MLREIHVRNLAVLAEAAVEFGAGFNVLSGETGAGKSIVVDSLSLLAGARASTEMVRTGAEALTVSGVFEPEGDGWRTVLEEAGLEAEGAEVLVRREIGRSGRNRVFVNDQPTTLRLLADLAPYLLRIHGQRDELGLIEPDLQRAMLDRSGGPEAAPLLARVAEACEQHARLAERLEHLSGDDRMRRERIDLLRFQASEIDAAKLRAGEEAELKAERDVLRNAEAITRSLGTAFALLFEEEGAAVERIGKAGSLLAEIEAWEPAAAAWRAEIEETRIRLTETARSLQHRLDGLEADPARLDFIEERLATIERLCRKHGGDSAAVLARRAGIEAELAELEGDAENRDELEGKVAAALAQYRDGALALSRGREEWGKALVERIEGELKDLGLARARLSVALERRRRAGSPLGDRRRGDRLRPRGDRSGRLPLRPQPRGAAAAARPHRLGGRAVAHPSRPPARLAGRSREGPSDAGLRRGGHRDRRRRGRRPGRQAPAPRQGRADPRRDPSAAGGELRRSPLQGRKRVDGDRTSVKVEELEAGDRVEEVARMLAGKKITDTSLSHARELIAGSARKRRG